MQAADASAPRFWNPRRKRCYALLALSVGAMALLSATAAWRSSHAFLINATESLPYWAFLIENDRRPERGEYVFFDPPRSALVTRHFGVRPPMFGKIVYGMPGDVVSREGRIFFINGKPVAVAKARSRLGEPLATGPTGTIPRDCYFVGTPHADGFDSRYAQIGWICRARLIGVGTPIL